MRSKENRRCRHPFRLVPFLLVVLVGAVSGQAAGVTVDRAVASLGEFPAEKPPATTFRLTNDTKEEIQILRLRSTCQACLELTLADKTLPPGGTVQLTAQVTPDSVTGDFSKTFYAELSGGIPRLLKLQVTGKALPRIVVSPLATAYVEGTPPGERIERIFTVRARDGEELSLGPASVSGVAGATCEYAGPASGTEVKLRLRFTPAAGLFQARAVVPVKSLPGAQPLVLVVRGRAGDSIFPSPRHLLVSPLSPKREFPFRLLLKSRSPNATLAAGKLAWDRLDGLDLRFDKVDGLVLSGRAIVSDEFVRRVASGPLLRVRIRLPGVGSTHLVFMHNPVGTKRNDSN